MAGKITQSFLNKQKIRLQEEKVKCLKQIESLKKDDPFNDPDRVSDNAAVDTEVREQDFHQIVEAKIRDTERRVTLIDSAIVKIGKGSYGYCQKCNKEIPLPRLEILPEARYCIDCETKLRK